MLRYCEGCGCAAAGSTACTVQGQAGRRLQRRAREAGAPGRHICCAPPCLPAALARGALVVVQHGQPDGLRGAQPAPELRPGAGERHVPVAGFRRPRGPPPHPTPHPSIQPFLAAPAQHSTISLRPVGPPVALPQSGIGPLPPVLCPVPARPAPSLQRTQVLLLQRPPGISLAPLFLAFDLRRPSIARLLALQHLCVAAAQRASGKWSGHGGKRTTQAG